MWNTIFATVSGKMHQSWIPAVLINKLYVVFIAIILFILARVIIRIANRSIQRLLEHQSIRLDVRRRRTMTGLATNVLRYVVYFFFIMALFELFHFPVQTLLTGAGVAGLVVGFGAQNLVRDVFGGFFIIFEDQFAVGDVITAGAYSGTVIEIGLRITKLAATTGEIHIIPNGQIMQVTNHSKDLSMVNVDIHVKNTTEMEQLLDTLDCIVEEAASLIKGIEGKINVEGIEDLGAADTTVRITAQCNVLDKARVAREIRLHVRIGLAKAYETMP